MTTCPTWTPAQRAAVKPWGIACLSLWAAELLSILTLAILLIASVPIGTRVIILWVGATIVAKRLLQILCMHQIRRITGQDWGFRPGAAIGRSRRSPPFLRLVFCSSRDESLRDGAGAGG